MAKSSEILR